MNFLKTVTDDLEAQAALKRIADAAAEQVWQEDFAKFCDKKKAFIADCIEAGLDVGYAEEPLKFPDPMPDRISIMTPVKALGYLLHIGIVAKQLVLPAFGRAYGYEITCTVDRPGCSKQICTADPDAKSLHDGLVQASKAALDEVLNAKV